MTLPASVELYNILQDPCENYLAAQYPEVVAVLQKRAIELAAEAAKPKLLEVGFESLLHEFHLPLGVSG